MLVTRLRACSGLSVSATRAGCRECDIAWIMDLQLPNSPVSESRGRNKSDVRTRKTPRRFDEGPRSLVWSHKDKESKA
jgi:hypothetical protein